MATMRPDGLCPVTRPASGEAIPQEVFDSIASGASMPFERSDLKGWYGNDVLWVNIHSQGAKRSEKFAWERLGRGSLTITALRVDAQAPPATAHIPNGYGDTGFQASGIDFPSAGCWEVVGTLAGKQLRFVVRVLDVLE